MIVDHRAAHLLVLDAFQTGRPLLMSEEELMRFNLVSEQASAGGRSKRCQSSRTVFPVCRGHQAKYSIQFMNDINLSMDKQICLCMCSVVSCVLQTCADPIQLNRPDDCSQQSCNVFTPIASHIACSFDCCKACQS